jgi:GntR family transcriptional repressor for pyruvate dehydrogenase complex
MTEAMNGAKISRAPNLTEQVTARLREAIKNGVHDVGKALPSEQAMSESFGVSRTVMREAISRLKAEGMVTTRQGLGVFVVSRQSYTPFRLDGSMDDPSVVIKVVELRMGLEVEAAGLAAARRTDADLGDMEAALDEMGQAIKRRDLSRGVTADIRFHRAICRATQNDNFLNFFEFVGQFLQDAIYLSRYRSYQTRHRERSVLNEHKAIYEAIASRDIELARTVTRIHIENTAKRVTTFAEGDIPLKTSA